MSPYWKGVGLRERGAGGKMQTLKREEGSRAYEASPGRHTLCCVKSGQRRSRRKNRERKSRKVSEVSKV